MAYFAQINEDSIVVSVNVVSNEDVGNLSFPESEPLGVEFLRSLYGSGTMWKQTSYNANFRKNYAGIGYKYDGVLDAFIPPKPYPSWILNEQTCLWDPPVPYPNDGKTYVWNESTLSWQET